MICRFGYSLDDSGNCIEITDNDCVRKNPNGSCLLCEGDNIPENGDCDEGSEECDIEGCEYCQKINTFTENCYLCEKGLVAYTFLDTDGEIKTECILENAKTLNCRVTLNNDSSKCKECLPNYYLENFSCKKAPYDTLIYELDNALIMIINWMVLFLLI